MKNKNEMNRECKTYQEKIDPQTGEKLWVEDKTALSFAYSMEELEKWVKGGAIPKDIGEFALKDIKKSSEVFLGYKKLVERNASEEEKLEYMRSQQESMEDLRKKIEFHKFILDNKESLLKIIESSEPQNKRKFRQSAHYIEQKLQYEKPSSNQTNIFDILSPETKDKVKGEVVRCIGIKLTAPEDKLVNSVSRLLEKKSQTGDQEADDFYMGNEPHRLIPFGQKKEKSPVLRCRKSELLNEFFGVTDHSGADIKYFDTVFNSFLERKWLLRYKRTIQDDNGNGKKGEKRHYIVEDYLPLVRVLKYFPNLSDEDSKKLEGEEKEFRSVAGEYILSLNPILTDQINSKYVEFPMDIDYRTRIAAGSHLAVSEAITRLRDFLIATMSAERYKLEINEETLIHRLHLEKHLKSRKKDRLQQQLNKAIQVSRHLGIILDVEEVLGVLGQKKYIFKLNKDFD